ncbi:aminoglycoside phosphotransferase family protein [Halobacillus campisalis]|uniref:Phosphotransferase n=1 Tax=Halobacillus campisalis TaxID=435909 RepID=A0ABW2K4A8_9BACI|nr:aminoglycoside phosphotransferase family protein [Halobacillus campisalis]
MTRNLKEGDSYTDRLFQWLRSRDMNITKFVKIKPKVYNVWVDQKPFLLKGYRRSNILNQQLSFFENWKEAAKFAATPVSFPDNARSLSKLGCDWALFTWINGSHANFDHRSDRKKAYHCLRQFHRSTKGLQALSIPRDPLYLKWGRRLEQFKNTREVFEYCEKKEFYDEVVTSMSRLLDPFARYSWGVIEEEAWEEQQWLHGDVAHHNFILEPAGSMKMIDFDLLHIGPKLYDEIQLAHRFLPYLENDRSAFFQLFKHVEYPEIWLRGVLVPADLVREWLHGYNKFRMGEDLLTNHIEKFEIAWQSRKQFVRYAEFMLR